METKFLLAVLWIFSASFAGAQTPDTLSLMQEIEQHPREDTFRVNRLNELSAIISWSLDKRDSAAREALAISRKIDYPEGMMQSLIQLSDIAAYDRGNSPEALSLLQKAYDIASEENIIEYQVNILDRKVIIKLNTTVDTTAIDDLSMAASLAEKLPDKTWLSAIQRRTGVYYTLHEINYPLSMEWTLISIQTAEKAGCTICLEDSYMSIGNLYSLLGDHKKALAYHQKALASMKDRGAKPDGNILNYNGEAYRLMGRYSEALQYYEEALCITKDSQLREILISNKADVYVRMDSLAPAFRDGFNALGMAERLNDVIGVAWIDGILARAYLKSNMPDSALYYAIRGMEAARQVDNLEYMRDNAGALARAYRQKNIFEKAYHWQDLYITYRDSMVNEDVTNQTNLLQYNYQKEKTQARIDLLNQQKKNQRTLLIAALSILGLIILSAIFLLHSNRRIERANKLLQQQKEEINAKANELTEKKESLERSYHNMELLGDIGRNITSSLSLEEVIRTVYDQVNTLMDAAIFGLGIYHERNKVIEFPATFENGEALPAYTNSIEDKNRFATVCLAQNREIVMGNLEDEYKDFVPKLESPHEGDQPDSLIFLPLISKGKKAGVITVQSFKRNAYTNYHLFMLRNIAIYTTIALENANAYGRLHQTLKDLRETQTQLIHAEKMASLGELTAGIAHEIQNPLNFVNNFAEVNLDLIKEMHDEIGKSNYNEVKELSADISKNEEKIIFHGKRADGIVKSMLQHSRNSSGDKELTDVNNLCDECLRLAYHGMRAKDKAFNSGMETDFSPSAGSIRIVPQDIGRVLLNLLTNAFYGVNEKRKNQTSDYKPMVGISTYKTGDTVRITVTDNGMGIPSELIDKIFQPFFTTKPTGKCTGLGLSLSYDIVKAHHGEIKVNTTENEGAEFIISLPVI